MILYKKQVVLLQIIFKLQEKELKSLKSVQAQISLDIQLLKLKL